MMSLDKINDYIDRLGLTKTYISKFFITESGKPATKQYIGQILNGTDVLGDESYRKLIIAINTAQMEKKKEVHEKGKVLDNNSLENL